MNKTITLAALTALVIGFGAGYLAPHGAAAAQTRGQFAGGNFAGRGARTGNGAVFGTVISKDANGITVQLGGLGATSTNGTASGTRIVFVNDSTQVMKTTNGSAADLSVGTGVVVTGTANSDGSLTATSIQIRPAGVGSRGQ